MLKPLTLVAIMMATTAPMAHAQDSDDNGDRYESVDRGDERGDPPMRDMRRGDRWAMDREERADDRGPADRDDDRDRGKDEDRKMDRDRAEMRDRDRDRGPRWDRDDRGPRLHGRGGPDWRRGPPPPPPRAGFEINLGEGKTVRVECGDEAFARCIDAAKPVLDSARDMVREGPVAANGADRPVTRVPPPPADLVTPPDGGPDAPPPAGDTPPAPAN
ncbi:hypothetical protein [Aureimonas sp. AU22]|uniref:hypothetical protein n=1 Tax=Aureimonas sp. AU22 TaxID=1638162 RepID=UPI00078278C3|nr:hypothetical protein [Aureimonas sp. AU22]